MGILLGAVRDGEWTGNYQLSRISGIVEGNFPEFAPEHTARSTGSGHHPRDGGRAALRVVQAAISFLGTGGLEWIPRSTLRVVSKNQTAS